MGSDVKVLLATGIHPDGILRIYALSGGRYLFVSSPGNAEPMIHVASTPETAIAAMHIFAQTGLMLMDETPARFWYN